MRTEEFIPTQTKEGYGTSLLRYLLMVNPKLTMIQIRRILINTYQRLRTNEGKELFRQTQKVSIYNEKKFSIDKETVFSRLVPMKNGTNKKEVLHESENK
jgi:hypothetical protein